MTDPGLRLDWCSYEAAKYACEHWHYGIAVIKQKKVKIGVWEDGVFVGCVLFGDGANHRVFEPYGLRYEEGCELVRIALRGHRTPVSRIVRIALGMLRRRCPGLRLVISFADPEHGHVGAIYQAGNWLYAGMTAPADEYIVNGKRMHGRALRSTRSHYRRDVTRVPNVMAWAARALDPNVRRVVGSAKHRYLMPLDAQMRQRLAPLARPYPKLGRAGVGSDTPAVRAGEGAAMRPHGSMLSPEAAG